MPSRMSLVLLWTLLSAENICVPLLKRWLPSLCISFLCIF